MDERNQKGLLPRQRRSVAIRIILLLLCVFILYGEYTLQNAERNRKELEESTQNRLEAVEKYEKEHPAIMNEYQTEFQDESNTYVIEDGKLYGGRDF